METVISKVKNMKKVLIGMLVVSLFLLAGFIFLERNDQNAKENLQELEKVKVQAGWLLNGEFANVCSAIINGYYQKRGLDVELVPGGPSGAGFIVATNAVALNDDLTIGIDGDIVPLLRGVTKENENEQLKVKAFAAFWNENPFGFMVRKDSGLNSIKDFSKRKPDGSKYRIGVTADSVIQDAIAQYTNVDVKELDIIVVGFDAAPLLASQVDALAGYWTTQAYELEKAGVDYNFLPASELPGFNQPSMVAVATDKTLNEKRETLAKWLIATNEGVAYVKHHPYEAAQHILDNRCGGPSFDIVQEQWLINKSIPLFDQEKPGFIFEQQVMEFAEAYRNLGQINRKPVVNEILDYSILNIVYPENE